VHYLKEHSVDEDKTRDLNNLQQGLLEYEGLLKQKLADLKEKM
jgi:hypothetical protein